MSGSNPLILYAEVKLCDSPVMSARVVAHLTAIDPAGRVSEPIQVRLLDNGSGGEFALYIGTFSFDISVG